MGKIGKEKLHQSTIGGPPFLFLCSPKSPYPNFAQNWTPMDFCASIHKQDTSLNARRGEDRGGRVKKLENKNEINFQIVGEIL
jgi:hypothetical protein